MTKRAAIYVRTSSEHQAEKSSPDEQEADCRALATLHDLVIVEVYRDISKYRAKSRLVDPSGTRIDRPGLNALLSDASQGRFDVILAWREDRLYRGMRAMLMVLDVIQQYRVEVMLAKETFDAKMAPLKAWVAQMELEGMRERMTMGVKARLRAGKANTGQDRYGYHRVGDSIEIVEEEAVWVRRTLAWYVEGVPKLEIRRRLIAAGAPQKGSSVPRRIEWALSSINAITSHSEDYASGKKRYSRKGEVFEVLCPPIIDWATHLKVLERRRANKTYPARHIKHDYLAGGLIRCECGKRWASITVRHRGKRKHHNTFSGEYRCTEPHPEHVHPNCPRRIGSKKADELLWSKVSEVITNPNALLVGARAQLETLQAQMDSLLSEKKRLEAALSEISQERQWVIRQARKGTISETDMEQQLAELEAQEVDLHGEWVSTEGSIALVNVGDWEQQVATTLEKLKEQAILLDAVPLNDADRQEQYDLRRQIVEILVDYVLITKDRDLKVAFKVNVASIVSPVRHSDQNKQVGTCNRILWSPLPRASAGAG